MARGGAAPGSGDDRPPDPSSGGGATTMAVLVLECADVAEADWVPASLPLVAAGLIEFEVAPLRAYSGFERLFGSSSAQ
jgi:hypothetical protein